MTSSPVPGLRPDAELAQVIAHANRSDNEKIEYIRAKEAFIIDMDGVIYHGNTLLPGVKEFVQWMKDTKKKFLFLTNNSAPTPRELQQKLARLGIHVDESHFYTSAICTAKFLSTQKPGGSVYAIGEPGLHYALYSQGFDMNEVNPDFVVVGEGSGLNYEKMARAVKLISAGAKLIGTNPDVNAVAEHCLVPACGAFVSAIELASGKKAFFCGKPTSLMMRYAQRILGCSRDAVCMVGDRLDTDVLGGIYAEIDTVLVLSGVSKREDLANVAYAPYVVVDGVGSLVPPSSSSVMQAANES
ncbi:TIGR01457 family HAD hydrolase [Allomyces macrogynus ATCC 38327]|uniref:4-nitrophenylphosphatase n=1 Tax=Allomyces macrogynus (strain ATCC 38327) TaxID=578462 RepID=A0A0L0T2A2_ALLM3|nr:TIGR01457 family HAD hydrolase [Allomyces macrogynus ATCC 38327]|eukprot:KNE68790.1 TIGR01457 family HAD hydrolase [Allomyces macrogynus ATCC 38327]